MFALEQKGLLFNQIRSEFRSKEKSKCCLSPLLKIDIHEYAGIKVRGRPVFSLFQ